jgi:peptidoglycan hydrolase-like protein with peptidoglycan-binding domain
MKIYRAAAAVLLAAGFAATAAADELTMMVEKDLAALGYDTGAVDGEETMETVIAISKFQAENSMEVTGEVTPQLAGILSAKVANPDLDTRAAASSAPAAPAPAPARDPAALQAAQQACLQEKVAAAQEAQKKKRGLGRLMSAVTRTAMRHGDYDLARTTSDIYSASATADDLAAAAKDLGLTEDEVAACQNP